MCEMGIISSGGHQAVGGGGQLWHGSGGIGTTKTGIYNTLEEIRRFEEALEDLAIID